MVPGFQRVPLKFEGIKRTHIARIEIWFMGTQTFQSVIHRVAFKFRIAF